MPPVTDGPVDPLARLPAVRPIGRALASAHETREVRVFSGSCARGGPERGFTGLRRQTRVLPSNAPDATTRCSNWGVASGAVEAISRFETSVLHPPGSVVSGLDGTPAAGAASTAEDSVLRPLLDASDAYCAERVPSGLTVRSWFDQ
jgi:hypothetical protein